MKLLLTTSILQPREITNPHTLEQHIGEVCSLSFCDELKVYASSSVDGQLKVWDLGNRLLDRVLLNKDPKVCFFNGGLGEIVVGQGNYLLKVTKDTWLPPGGQRALDISNNQLAVMKIQARVRGSSIRRMLGTGIRQNKMTFVEGDSAFSSEVTVLGRDGKMRRKKQHGGGAGREEGARGRELGLLNDGRRRRQGGGREVKVAKNVVKDVEQEGEGSSDEEPRDRRQELKNVPSAQHWKRDLLSHFSPRSPSPVSTDGTPRTLERRVAGRKHRKLRLAGGQVIRRHPPSDSGSTYDATLSRSSDATVMDRIKSMAPSLSKVAKRYATTLQAAEARVEAPNVPRIASAPTVPSTPNYVSANALERHAGGALNETL